MSHRDYDFDTEQDRAAREDRSGTQWALLSIARSLLDIDVTLKQIATALDIFVGSVGPHLVRLELSIMPKTITVGQTATAHLTGTGSDGLPFAFKSTDSVSIIASVGTDVAVAAPTFNADGSIDVVITGVAPDPTGDSITATVDGVTSNSDILTITAVQATLASVTLALQ